MGHVAGTIIIDISKNTFEAWRRGEKKIAEFGPGGRNTTYQEEDFIGNEEICKDVVKTPGSDECPDSEHVHKRLNAVNSPGVRRDLLYVIHKYDLAERGWQDISTWNRDGSYVSFLRYYMVLSDFGIPRKYVREEYVDPMEWEFMKDADGYAIVRQNPYMRVEDDGKNVKITMWGD